MRVGAKVGMESSVAPAMRSLARRGGRGVVGAVIAITLVLALAPITASAAVPKFFTQIGDVGSGAGLLENTVGIAVDPRNSHLLVVDNGNNSTAEFTPWGEFVKAFGWDVAPGAVNEQQEVRLRATAGEFRLAFDASTTLELPFDATADEVEAALNALPTISAGGGSVSVKGGPGGFAGITPSVYVVSFDAGSLAGSDVSQLVAEDGTTPLSGGDPATLLEASTRADGTPGGTGLEACTAESGCQAGVRGTGVGQFSGVRGISIDAAGSIYTFEFDATPANLRVQKFGPTGDFSLMLGGEVNKTTGASICTKADLEGGDTCGAGVLGTGPGEFNIENVVGIYGDYLEVGPTGTVYVGDRDRIQEFDSNGNFTGEISYADVHAEEPAFPASGNPGALAVDPTTGDIYFAFAQGVLFNEKVHGLFRLSPSGGFLDRLETVVASPLNTDAFTAVGVDSEGNVYAIDRPVLELPKNGGNAEMPNRVVEFDSAGSLLIPYSEGFNFTFLGNSSGGGPVYMNLTGLATNALGNVFVGNRSNSFQFPIANHINAYGSPPLALEPPPKVAPEVLSQFAASVDVDGAVVKAEISPHLWADTRYYVEYGTEPCASATCVKAPAPPGSLLTGEVTDATLTSAGVFLGELQAGTTYHYRFVAQSGGGGPVYGVDPDADGPGVASFEDGAEGTFTTFRSPGQPDACPANETFRTGPSASLPDCRAYEMVSPVDKGGADIAVLCENLCFPAELNQSAASGGALTYSSSRSFGDAQSAPFTSQYLARRGAGGWTSEGISPPLEDERPFGPTQAADTMFRAFSTELEEGWLVQDRPPALEEGSETPNIYRRDNAGGTYRALLPEALHAYPDIQGVTPDGRCMIFVVADKLTENAADLPSSGQQLYESCEGQAPTLVSVLPTGFASTVASSAGTAGKTGFARSASLSNAISDDGSRIFWSGSGLASPLYLRLNPAEPESAHLHGVAEGTGDLIGPAAGTGNTTKSAKIIVKVTNAAAFAAGQQITGPTIPAGTTVTKVESEKLTISNAATATQSEAPLTGAASETVTNVVATAGAFAAGQEISAPNGIPAATTVVQVDEAKPGVFTLTLSAKAAKSATGVTLSASSPCTEPAKACTVTVSSQTMRFWGAAADGSKAIFSIPGGSEELFEYDVEAGQATSIAKGFEGVVGMSEDVSRLYFVARDGTGPAAGKPSLFLREGGTRSFVATLSEADLEGSGPASLIPVQHAARVSPDGRHVAFISAARLTGYDNTDQRSGQADAQVFLYDAVDQGLVCVSCNPTGARPRDAATLPAFQNQLYGSRVLSPDGQYLFFESAEALVPRDTNGKADVYQWEALGTGGCEEEDQSYQVASGGCVELISSGKSPVGSVFVDASSDGRDVFFKTEAKLLQQDPGLVDVYDARADGGFPPPAAPPPSCEGEACQGSPEAPNDPTPASEAFQGAGNAVGATTTKAAPCPKGKVRRKSRCVAKKKHKHHRAKRTGGSSR